MTEQRDRLLTLINENSAFGIGRAYERDLLIQQIRARLQELGDMPHMDQARNELIFIINLLHDSTDKTRSAPG